MKYTTVVGMIIRQILLRGPPGSGKSTFGKLFRERLPTAKCLSSGDLLRKYFQQHPEGAHAVERGGLADSELVHDLMHDEFMQSKREGTKLMLIDGFPRKLEELITWIARTGPPALVVYLDSPYELIVNKLRNRWLCGTCGAMYNLFHDETTTPIAPRIHMVCDMCKQALIQREDDEEEVIRSRLNVHQDNERGIIEYFQTAQKVERIIHLQSTGNSRDHLDRVFREMGIS